MQGPPLHRISTRGQGEMEPGCPRTRGAMGQGRNSLGTHKEYSNAHGCIHVCVGLLLVACRLQIRSSAHSRTINRAIQNG